MRGDGEGVPTPRGYAPRTRDSPKGSPEDEGRSPGTYSYTRVSEADPSVRGCEFGHEPASDLRRRPTAGEVPRREEPKYEALRALGLAGS